MIKVSTTGMAVSLKTDLRFPESGQHGHGSRIIQEKINTNIQNPLYSINIIGWSFLFILQLFWIQHTVLKIYKLIPLSNTYEEKEKQLFAFVPVYIISILLFGLTIYTKFF